MNVESVPSNENQQVSEVEPSQEIPVQQPAPEPQPVPADTPVSNVVDMRTHNEELEGVDESADKLTKDADEEEEDFIHHVEEVHTIK